MLTEEQIEAIAASRWEFIHQQDWIQADEHEQRGCIEMTSFVANKAIAIQAEQDRRSFIAVGKYIGVSFTAGTDVVSEVYNKLDEIMTVFREHSQEIAIVQNIKILTNLLERYVEQQAAPIFSGSVGEKEGRPVCDGDCGKADSSDRDLSEE